MCLGILFYIIIYVILDCIIYNVFIMYDVEYQTQPTLFYIQA
jgi:hypothetical protein